MTRDWMPSPLSRSMRFHTERDLAARGHEQDIGPATRRLGQDIGALTQARGRSILGAIECRDILTREDDCRGLMVELHHDLPRLNYFVRISGTQYDQAGNRSQRGELLDGLVRRAVFTHADGVVSENVDHWQFHQGGQADRRAAVVTEDQEP